MSQQLKNNQKPSDFIIHVHLNDQDAKLQQETIGVIGANLLHSCFTEKDPKDILKTCRYLSILIHVHSSFRPVL